MSRILLGELPVDQLPGDLLAVPFFADQLPPDGPAALVDWRLNGIFSRLLADGRATGQPGERILLAGNGKVPARWLLFQGAGRWQDVAGAALVEALVASCLLAGYSRFALGLPPVLAEDAAGIVAAVERARHATGCGEMDCAIGFWPAVVG